MTEQTTRSLEQPTLHGVIPIPVTTFDEDGRLDVKGLHRQVEFCLDAGVDGVLYPGVVSEFYTLTDEERRAAVEAVVSATQNAVPVAVGVSAPSTAAAASFAAHAADSGAVAVMTMVPFIQHFFGPDSAYVRRHMEAVAEASGVPVILQNARVGFPLGARAVAEVVAAVDGIRYVKEESNPPTHGIAAVLEATGDRLDGVFGGIGGVYLVNELERGAVGTMPSPAFVDRIVEAFRTYRAHGAAAAQQQLDAMASLFTRELLYNVVLHKEVLYRRGVIRSTAVRIATPALDEVDLAELDRMMATAGLT